MLVPTIVCMSQSITFCVTQPGNSVSVARPLPTPPFATYRIIHRLRLHQPMHARPSIPTPPTLHNPPIPSPTHPEAVAQTAACRTRRWGVGVALESLEALVPPVRIAPRAAVCEVGVDTVGGWGGRDESLLRVEPAEG